MINGRQAVINHRDSSDRILVLLKYKRRVTTLIGISNRSFQTLKPKGDKREKESWFTSSSIQISSTLLQSEKQWLDYLFTSYSCSYKHHIKHRHVESLSHLFMQQLGHTSVPLRFTLSVDFEPEAKFCFCNAKMFIHICDKKLF